MKPECVEEGCGRPQRGSHGYCDSHYKRHWLAGTLPRPRTTMERFMSKIEVLPDGCWRWLGKHNNHGRPIFFLRISEVGERREVLAYRWAYEQLIGPIPDGLVLDHYVCHRGGQGCANPFHCRPERNEVNAANTRESRKTHCKHGHPRTPENTYIRPDGKGKMCHPCMLATARRNRKKAK